MSLEVQELCLRHQCSSSRTGVRQVVWRAGMWHVAKPAGQTPDANGYIQLEVVLDRISNCPFCGELLPELPLEGEIDATAAILARAGYIKEPDAVLPEDGESEAAKPAAAESNAG